MENIGSKSVLALIGGSGLYDMEGLEEARTVSVMTPFGAPSDDFVVGRMHDVSVVFLARHGKGHRLLPSEVPYRANIYALKTLGVSHMLSVGAVGSLREPMRPRDLVLVNQYLDFTKRRETTFFGEGLVGHVSMAQPTCTNLDNLVYEAACEVLGDDAHKVHRGGTYVCIEGPQFSSLAESRMFQALGADVIGMTNMPEAKLAREAQIAYSSLTMVTDYDCWHKTHSTEDVGMILANLLAATEDVKRILPRVVAHFAHFAHCAQSAHSAAHTPQSRAHGALDMAVITPPEMQGAEAVELLRVLRGSRNLQA